MTKEQLEKLRGLGLEFDGIWDEIATDDSQQQKKILQINITRKPVDFGDTLIFEITTNLDDGENIEIAIKEDSLTKPTLLNIRKTISKTKTITITFTSKMEDEISGFTGDIAKCYIKITNPNINDLISEDFDVTRGNLSVHLPGLLDAATKYTPEWQAQTEAVGQKEDAEKLKKDASKTPKRTFSDSELIDLAATIIGESGNGALSLDQQMAIAWVYYNRLTTKNNLSRSMDSCLNNFSYAYRRKNGTIPADVVMMVMVGLGNDKHANDRATGEPFNGKKTITEILAEKAAYIEVYIEKGRKLNDVMTKDFMTPSKNLFPGFTNQGYHKDLNTPTDDHLENINQKIVYMDTKNGEDSKKMWVRALAYYWLQRDGTVANRYDSIYVKELLTLGAERSTTFIFKAPEISTYFKRNPTQDPKFYRDIPMYNYHTRQKTFADIYFSMKARANAKQKAKKK
jgi:hypothetical protein